MSWNLWTCCLETKGGGDDVTCKSCERKQLAKVIPSNNIQTHLFHEQWDATSKVDKLEMKGEDQII